VKEYELSFEFWLWRALIERLSFPFQFFEYEMDDEIWFWSASVTDDELYRLFDGLEKLTDAENEVPGLALESCEWLHLTPKFFVGKKSLLPRSPVWSFE
jgi:hypothetical protein